MNTFTARRYCPHQVTWHATRCVRTCPWCKDLLQYCGCRLFILIAGNATLVVSERVYV
jgi:hypothetical protein